MSRIDHWTPDQAWAVYQVIDQIQQEILRKHKESIRYFQWREKMLDEYVERIEQMSEEERMAEGVWLEPKGPDDLVGF
ncbi:MAG: hypothetical protein ABW166_10625 [Sedimenticola sp.]